MEADAQRRRERELRPRAPGLPCQLHLGVVEAKGAHVFTDGNAAAAFTEFHDDADRLDQVVDWPLMRATMWANTPDDPDRRRRRGAEFLVHQALPFELVDELGVYDRDARSAVAAAAADAGWDVDVHIRRDWYFQIVVDFVTGNLLEADAEALVNAVNTKGVMGKGVAPQSKRASPRVTRRTTPPAPPDACSSDA